MKIGQKIHIIHLYGEDKNYDGKEGYITHIDDMGQLHGTWGGLAIIPEVDNFRIVKNKNLCCICGKEISSHGNNPYPIRQGGVCCDECYSKVVIPARMASKKG